MVTITFELPETEILEFREFLRQIDLGTEDFASQLYVIESGMLLGRLSVRIDGTSMFREKSAIWLVGPSGEANRGDLMEIDSTLEIGALVLLRCRKTLADALAGAPAQWDLGYANSARLVLREDELCFEFKGTYEDRCGKAAEIAAELVRLFKQMNAQILGAIPELASRPEASRWFDDVAL